jgi:hypothetical protein
LKKESAVPSATRIRFENLTDRKLFFYCKPESGEFKIKISTEGGLHDFELLPGKFASIPVTPEIRTCYDGSNLVFEFSHKISGGLMFQYWEEAFQQSDGSYAALFRFSLPAN